MTAQPSGVSTTPPSFVTHYAVKELKDWSKSFYKFKKEPPRNKQVCILFNNCTNHCAVGTGD